MNLIETQPDIDKIYLYATDLYEANKYSIKICEKVGIDHHNDPRAHIECSNNMYDVYKNINYYSLDKENKIWIVFDDMIADMINNKTLNSIVTELLIRGRNLNIFFVFITQSYCKVPKDVRFNTTHFFIAKNPNRRELRELVTNHSWDISAKDFTNIYRKSTVDPYSLLVNDTTLASDNPLRFRKLLLEYNKNHDN